MVENIPLPRLLPGATWTERRIMPEKVSVNLNITPLSHATITLPECESVPARGYIEVFTCMGSAGIYRVRAPQESYGNDSAVAELEHAVVEVGDWLVLASYDEMKAAGTAMTTIFSHYRGTKWQLGSVTALGSGNVAMQANHISVLEAMLSIMEQKPDCMMTFDFSTTPWTINIVQRGTTVAAEGRLSRNINFAKITYDDTELCTRAYYEKEVPASGNAQPTSEWLYVDADTIGTYGLIEKSVPTGSNYTAAEALQAATIYLNKHKHPRISVEINLEELSSTTGEPMDTFEIGKLCRLALVDYNTTVEKCITGMGFPDVYDQPTNITVNLAEEEDAAINFIHDVDAKGGYGGGGAGRRKQDQQFKEYRTRFDQDDYHIALVSEHADRANSILQAAGIDINSQTGVVIYHTDNENMLQSKMNVQAGQIGLVVQGTGANASIKAAQIWASIDMDMRQSHVTISADIIDIDGIVDDLVGYDVAAESLTAHQITSDGECSFDTVVAGSVQVGSGEDVYELNVADISVSGNTMTITYVDGTTENFSKATTLSGEWSGTTAAGKSYKVTATPQGDILYSPQIDGITPRANTKTWASNKKSFTQSIYVYDEDGEDLIEDTLTFTTTDSYNKGWNDARDAMVIPTAAIGAYIDGSYAKMTVEKPNADGSSSTTDYEYTLDINSSFTPSGASSSTRAAELKINGNVVARKTITDSAVGTITTISAPATGVPKVLTDITASGIGCTSKTVELRAMEGTFFDSQGVQHNSINVWLNLENIVLMVEDSRVATTIGGELYVNTGYHNKYYSLDVDAGSSSSCSGHVIGKALKSDGTTVVISGDIPIDAAVTQAYNDAYSTGFTAGQQAGPSGPTISQITTIGLDAYIDTDIPSHPTKYHHTPDGWWNCRIYVNGVQQRYMQTDGSSTGLRMTVAHPTITSNGTWSPWQYSVAVFDYVVVDVPTSNPYPQTKTMTCTGATFRASEWHYTFEYVSSNSGLFTSGNDYKFHNNSSYT